MSPIAVVNRPGGATHPNPFRGPIDHTDQIRLDVSAMTTFEVDQDGYLKPGVLLTKAGILVGIAPAYCYGANIEAVKIAADNAPATLAAAPDVDIGVATHASLNLDILEDILGRVLTANELAGFERAGSNLTLNG